MTELMMLISCKKLKICIFFIFDGEMIDSEFFVIILYYQRVLLHSIKIV